MIKIESKRKKIENIQRENPSAVIIDITSRAKDVYGKLSPFYPHGDIPIPFTEGMTATCVEGVWQGLKVFEHCDVDMNSFRNDTMQNLKRTVRKYGKPLGHRKGVYGKELLGYMDARKLIYIPTYKWMLENKALDIVERLRKLSKTRDIVLLDYNTNQDVDDPTKPLSHAYLVKAYIEGLHPYGRDKSKVKQQPKELSLFDYGKED